MKKLVIAASVLMLSLAIATPAFAHSHLASSSPSAGQTVAASPAAVLLTFDAELGTGSTATVTDAAGAAVSTGATVNVNDRVKMSVALKSALANGVYKVS